MLKNRAVSGCENSRKNCDFGPMEKSDKYGHEMTCVLLAVRLCDTSILRAIAPLFFFFLYKFLFSASRRICRGKKMSSTKLSSCRGEVEAVTFNLTVLGPASATHIR